MSAADGPTLRRRAMETARQVPGLSTAYHGTLTRLRSSTSVVDLAGRVLGPNQLLGRFARPMRAGAYLRGPALDRLPVVVFLLLDLDEDELTAQVEAVAELQRATRAFRPVLVVDRPVFAVLRPHGYVVDHVLARSDWPGRPEDYDAYRGRRLVSVRENFGPWHMVGVVPGQGIGTDDRLMLESIGGSLFQVVPRPEPVEAPAPDA